MFEDKTEAEARQEILALVEEYAARYREKKKPFQPGDRISYASRVYDHKEMVNAADAVLEFWLTSGRFSDLFEKKLGEYLGVPYVSLVNSGSSANLLAFMALTSPKLGERRVKRGDEVITVACGFPTTVTPIIQYGAVPVFVDVCIPQYNIDVTKLETALSEKTKAVMIAHTLGNPFDLKAVKAFCDAHGLWLIEDNCDALGSRYTLDGETRFTGTIGDIGTSSFYPPRAARSTRRTRSCTTYSAPCAIGAEIAAAPPALTTSVSTASTGSTANFRGAMTTSMSTRTSAIT